MINILVFVHFDNESLVLLESKFFNKFDHYVSIDMSKDFHLDDVILNQTELNTFFEFSGYQLGLNYLVRKLSSFTTNEELNIFFVNDTIFESHFLPTYKFMLNYFLSQKLESETLNGIIQKKNGYKIIPTCFFCLTTRLDTIKYNKNFILPDGFYINDSINFSYFEDNSLADLYVGDYESFNTSVNNWLKPKGFFKGWYKANPYKEIDSDTFNRKKLCIYLEHSLVSNLANKGVTLKVNDYFIFKLMVKLDQYYQLSIKFGYRFMLFFRHFFNDN